MIDESTLPKTQRILLALNRADAGMTTADLAASLDVASKVVATNVWMLRPKNLVASVDGVHTLTAAGKHAASRIAAGEGMPRYASDKPTPKRSTPQASRLRRPATTAIATRQDAPPPAKRNDAAASHADGLIGNALNAIDLHELLLDESVELTPLVRASIDGIRRAVGLIGSAYQVARP